MIKVSYTELIENHYKTVWNTSGTKRNWDKGPLQDLPDDFHILEFAPHDHRNMWTYATCGMSLPDDESPIELHMFSLFKDEEIIELLTAIAHYHRNDSALDLGHTINFGRPWINESEATFGLISLPYLDGQNLEILKNNDNIIHFYWLIPITEREREFKKIHGIEELEKILELKQFNYLDPHRKSVI